MKLLTENKVNEFHVYVEINGIRSREQRTFQFFCNVNKKKLVWLIEKYIGEILL